jgi:hypothetical protein
MSNITSEETSPSTELLVDQESGQQVSPLKPYPMLLAAIETTLIIIGLLGIWLLLPFQAGADGKTRYNDISHFLLTLKLFDPHSRYSLIGPLFSTPLFLIGEKLGNPYQWTCWYNLILFSLCLLVSYFLLRNYVDRVLLRKFFLVLVYGSMFAAHLTSYYGETFTALCVGFGVFVTFRRFTPIGGWLAVALGVINTPATTLGLGLLLLKRMLDNKRLRYALVFVIACGCILMEYWLRRGSIFSTGFNQMHGSKTVMPYSGLPEFSYPIFFGVLSIIFSFGRGLLFYIPGLLLPIRKTLSKWPLDQKIDLYQVYTLWIWFVVGLLLVYSRWWAWWGGNYFWGPRYFLFACIPASFALAVRLIRYKEASLGVNLLTFVVFCLSAWVSIDGAVFQLYVTIPRICSYQKFEIQVLCLYTPEYSSLWMPFVFHMQVPVKQALFGLLSLLVAIYMVTPLFIHLLRQINDLAKKYGERYLKLSEWRI